MKNYDDLQRFKEKTRNTEINFKDMSGQNVEAESGHWAIIQQLMSDTPDASPLSKAASVSVAVPEPVSQNTFDIPQAVQAGLSGQPAPQSHSAAAQQPLFAVPPAVNPVVQAPPFTTPSTANAAAQQPLFAVPPVVNPAVQQPLFAASPKPAREGGGRFSQLFSSKSVPASDQQLKEMPLSRLLEMIALCH